MMRFDMILNPVGSTPAKAAATAGLIAAAGLLACAAGAAAWAQAPGQKLADGPTVIRSDHVMTSGCETIFSGNVTAVQAGVSVAADLLRVVAAEGPKKCGPLRTVDAYGNVTAEDQGKVLSGQAAHFNVVTGSLEVN